MEECLSKNLEYQEVLIQRLKEIDKAQAGIDEARQRIHQTMAARHQQRSESERRKRMRRTEDLNLHNLLFESSGGATVGPPPNPHAREKARLRMRMPMSHVIRIWNSSLRQKLRESVMRHVEEMVLRNRSAGAQSDGSVGSLIEILLVKPETADLLNWDSVSQHVPGRNGAECCAQWLHFDRPGLRLSKWTKDEDKQLAQLAHQYQGLEWEKVAAALRPGGRTAAACFSRYQQSINPSLVRSAWSHAEDAQLKAAVKKYGERDWQRVASKLSGRAGQQCLQRWEKVLNPKLRKGQWSEGEDRALQMGVKAYGLKWARVCRAVEGRSDMACRERYMNVLAPSLNHKEWGEEEDAALLKGVGEVGLSNWADVSARFVPSRTDNQCLRRYRALNAHRVNSDREISRKNKPLPATRAGRKSRTTSLTVDEFIGAVASVTSNPTVGAGAGTAAGVAAAAAVAAATAPPPSASSSSSSSAPSVGGRPRRAAAARGTVRRRESNNTNTTAAAAVAPAAAAVATSAAASTPAQVPIMPMPVLTRTPSVSLPLSTSMPVPPVPGPGKQLPSVRRSASRRSGGAVMPQGRATASAAVSAAVSAASASESSGSGLAATEAAAAAIAACSAPPPPPPLQPSTRRRWGGTGTTTTTCRYGCRLRLGFHCNIVECTFLVLLVWLGILVALVR